MTKMFHYKRAIFIPIAIALSSCVTPPPPYEYVQIPAVSSGAIPVSPQAVSILNETLREIITVPSVHAHRQQNGNTEIVVRLKNKADKAQRVEARTEFLTASGVPSEAISGWSPLLISGKSSTAYMIISTSQEQAQLFKVEIRSANY